MGTPYIGDGRSSPPLNLGNPYGPCKGYTNPPTWLMTFDSNPSPLQPCKAPCNGLFKGILSAEFMTSKKLNRNKMEQINNGSVRNRKKKHEHLFSLKLQCVADAVTQFKTATLGAFLLKKMIENASAGHNPRTRPQRHLLSCRLHWLQGRIPRVPVSGLAVDRNPNPSRSLVIDLQGTDFHMAMIFTTST